MNICKTDIKIIRRYNILLSDNKKTIIDKTLFFLQFVFKCVTFIT